MPHAAAVRGDRHDGRRRGVNWPTLIMIALVVLAWVRTPRATAIAGILFSLWLLQLSIPADALEVRDWLKTSSRRVSVA